VLLCELLRALYELVPFKPEERWGTPASTRAVAAGAVAAATAAMCAAPSDAELQMRGCNALFCLTTYKIVPQGGDADTPDVGLSSEVAAGAIKAVLAALILAADDSQSHDQLWLMGLQAMGKLWRVESWAAYGGDAVRSVLAVMGAHMQHLDLQRVCCGVLAMLMLKISGRLPRHIDMRGCVRAVLAAMRAYPQDADLQKQGAMALVLMSANTAAGYHACEELGAVAAFEAARRAHPQHDAALLNIAMGAEQFAQRPTCDWPGCQATSGGVDETKLRRCAACLQTKYCSKACQAAHWPAHKTACRAARDAAQQLAGDEGEAGGAI
jgi:hypothetical protein